MGSPPPNAIIFSQAINDYAARAAPSIASVADFGQLPCEAKRYLFIGWDNQIHSGIAVMSASFHARYVRLVDYEQR